MASLVHTGIYGSINASDPTTMRYYTVRYIYGNFILQEDTTIGVYVSKEGGLLFRAEYLSSMKSKKICYCKQN